jgi:hypothetical protein
MESLNKVSGEHRQKSVHKKTDDSNKDKSVGKLQASQKTDLKEALKEGLLISKGEIKGTPLSELWKHNQF